MALKPKHLILWGILLFILIGDVRFLHSADCLDPSPTQNAGKDPYGPIDVRDLTKKEYEGIRLLLKSLAGEWQGLAKEYHCKHMNDPQKMEINNDTIQAKVEVDYYGNFVLWADLHSARKKSSHKETFRLYLKKKRLRANRASRFGDVELIKVSPDTVEFLYRRVLQMGPANSSTRREYFISLNVTGESFSIKRRIYTQGRLSSKRVWQFNRR